MKVSRKLEQHIAVFGESGSGKTVLLSSFYGASQEQSFRTRALFNVVSDDVGQGNKLYKNYIGMRERAELPASNRFTSTSYSFSIKLKADGGTKTAGKHPFDALRLVWHDYPGEWFEQDVSGPEESERRLDTFKSLLGSDVALLLVDAQKLLDNAGEEERYLKSLILNFRNGLLSLKDDLLLDGRPLAQFPRIWVLALSKADLMPGMDVYAFRDLVIGYVADELDDLRRELAAMVEGKALSIGEDFVLLSSAKFEPGKIDLTDRIGIELVLPIAAMLPFERHVQWAERKELPGKVVDNLVDNAGLIAGIIMGTSGKFAKTTSILGKVLRFMDADLIAQAARSAGEQLKKFNTESREKGDTMRSILTGFKMDLEKGEKDQILLRSQQ